MKLAVIQFPGSNCDRDMLNAAVRVGLTAEFVDYRETSLDGFDGVLIPGGFSFGDYLRTGAMASVAPITQAIKDAAAVKKPVVGICNGFQILTELKLLPGALIHNNNHNFISRDESIRVKNNTTDFTKNYEDNQNVIFPIAHGEGQYFATPETLDSLEENNQIVFTYNNNPNGSARDIAGIINKEGNVLGMMPHPERAMEMLLGSEDGLQFFKNIAKWGRQ